MRIITIDDIIDVYQKVSQRGLGFILSKFNPIATARTKSAFDNSAFQNANWWIVPAVRQRWNEKISGNKEVEYEEHIKNTYLKNLQKLKMLSIGSGVCSHELTFATYPNFSNITCVDIADNLLKIAQEKANKNGLENIEFSAEDIYKKDIEGGEYDIILFHMSLHHFSNIESLIIEKIKKWLKPKGLLIINEYVGPDRLQISRKQIKFINKGLDMIPPRLKRRFKTNLNKNRFYGSGYLRMVIADPSECKESSQILPILQKEFKVLEEKPYGGNLIMNILKDISHNFVTLEDEEAQKVLADLFELEDSYLTDHVSDFLFGVYEN